MRWPLNIFAALLLLACASPAQATFLFERHPHLGLWNVMGDYFDEGAAGWTGTGVEWVEEPGKITVGVPLSRAGTTSPEIGFLRGYADETGAVIFDLPPAYFAEGWSPAPNGLFNVSVRSWASVSQILTIRFHVPDGEFIRESRAGAGIGKWTNWSFSVLYENWSDPEWIASVHRVNRITLEFRGVTPYAPGTPLDLDNFGMHVLAVPEPSTLGMAGVGLLACACYAARSRRCSRKIA